MKKILLFAIVAFANVFISNAQEKAIIKVIYNFEHVQDTIVNYRYNEEMGLLVGKSISSYYSQRKLTQDSISRKAWEQAEINGGNVNLGVILPTTTENYFVLLRDKKILIAAPYHQELYLINNQLELIKWSINKNTKNIKGYNCQQAIGKFKGRTYTAWFASELPTNAGPWKLNGLPGLILEATDLHNEVRFMVKTIQKMPGQFITIPTTGIKTNLKDFNKMTKAYSNGGYSTNSILSNPDLKINGQSISSSSNKRGHIPVINNPIEISN